MPLGQVRLFLMVGVGREVCGLLKHRKHAVHEGNVPRGSGQAAAKRKREAPSKATIAKRAREAREAAAAAALHVAGQGAARRGVGGQGGGAHGGGGGRGGGRGRGRRRCAALRAWEQTAE